MEIYFKKIAELHKTIFIKIKLLQVAFETLISSYIENKIGICNLFVSEKLGIQLKTNLLALHEKKLMIAAGTGNVEKLVFDKLVRSDSIYWLDRQHADKYENEFLDLMDDFISYLNLTCYTGITGCEFHYTLYEAGSFYKKHIDQFQNNESRKFSMISYLNKDWVVEDGGQLMIHQSNSEQEITPTNGKTIFFKSNELPHEVLVTNKQRVSITGWLTS